MSILNQDMDFAAARNDVRDAFLRRESRKTLYPFGTILCRLVTNQQSGIKGNETVGEWWITTTMLGQFRERASAAGASVNDYARARSAVSMEWNEKMDQLCRVRLLRPVYGFEGRSSGQACSQQQPKVMLIGGATQIWIPDLKPVDVRIVYYGSIE